jgi:hypothetical protein
MIKFTFGCNLREGLGLLLTDEGLEKALESAIETYNWYIEKDGKAPSGFYCILSGGNQSYFKSNTAFYDAKFIYEVMPYSFTFNVNVEDLIFEDKEGVEYDKPYRLEEFFSKDLSGVEGACVLVMFKDSAYAEASECFCRPDLLVGQILSNKDDDYFIRVNGHSYVYDIHSDEFSEDCKVMLPSRSNLLKEHKEE